MIVVDASALIAFFFREENWVNLAQYMVETISVDQIVKEFYNTLWKSVKVRKTIALEDAIRIAELFKSYIEKNMVIEPEEKYIEHAFKLALKHNITVYDALYIAQAIHYNLPLLTLDQKQRQAALEIGVKILP
ncbi:MAG: type II toxin-antitoxin system VapC family toxin [Ignisphaera sp.]